MTIDQPQPDASEDRTTDLADVRRAHNVVAAFPSLEAAREAVLSLERGNIPADHIALLGARPDPDATEIDDPDAQSEVPKKIVAGAATGATGAAAIGALTALAIPGIGPAVAAGIWAIAGATTGAMVGGVSGMGGSEAWRQTFTAVESGNVAVGVHTDDADEAERGGEILAGLEPLAINHFED